MTGIFFKEVSSGSALSRREFLEARRKMTICFKFAMSHPSAQTMHSVESAEIRCRGRFCVQKKMFMITA